MEYLLYRWPTDMSFLSLPQSFTRIILTELDLSPCLCWLWSRPLPHLDQDSHNFPEYLKFLSVYDWFRDAPSYLFLTEFCVLLFVFSLFFYIALSVFSTFVFPWYFPPFFFYLMKQRRLYNPNVLIGRWSNVLTSIYFRVNITK